MSRFCLVFHQVKPQTESSFTPQPFKTIVEGCYNEMKVHLLRHFAQLEDIRKQNKSMVHYSEEGINIINNYKEK